jgi:hypothetical protein
VAPGDKLEKQIGAVTINDEREFGHGGSHGHVLFHLRGFFQGKQPIEDVAISEIVFLGASSGKPSKRLWVFMKSKMLQVLLDSGKLCSSAVAFLKTFLEGQASHLDIKEHFSLLMGGIMHADKTEMTQWLNIVPPKPCGFGGIRHDVV